MGRLFLPVKEAIMAVVNKHFPPDIASRFSVRMDSEIFIPSEDEGVWNRWKQQKEIPHVLFDMVEIFEIPPSIPKNQLEYVFLNFIKFALEDGRISINIKPEYTDQATAKRRKAEKKRKRDAQLKEIIKRTMDDPIGAIGVDNYVKANTQKVRQVKKQINH